MLKLNASKVCMLFFAAALSFSAVAQERPALPKKKKPNIGFTYNRADWDTDNLFKDSIYGFSAIFTQGITSHLDYSARFNGLFSNKTVNDKISSNRMSSELEAALHLKAFKDKVAVNPFLTAGVGVGNYVGKQWRPYAPLGAGVQFNVNSELYFVLQGNYRLSFDEAKHPNTAMYSVGLTRSLWSRPKVKDADKDGVPDEMDACPTIPGLAALNGCPDTDGDGVADKDDKCPTEAGPAALGGCPDRDGDGIADKDDACPDVAGSAALNGCPDADGDGIADKDDKCPNQAGPRENGGCPWPDTDGDGVLDKDDKCPSQAGPRENGGCPWPDTDGDGILDKDDKCPTIAGTRENNGCPTITEEVKKKVEVAAKNILFVTGSAKLQKSSFKGLDEVVRIMNENEGMKLNIEGHTDNTGSEALNQKLSEDRAAAVRDYIISKGIDESRIESAGYGLHRPIADNKTAAGRTKNRRVELLLSYYK